MTFSPLYMKLAINLKSRLHTSVVTSVVTTIFFSISLQSPIVNAFVPGGFKAVGTGGLSHKEMTEEALNDLYKDYDFGSLGSKPLTKAMKKARDQIEDANAAVDDEHPTESEYHCDAESFPECSNLIDSLLTKGPNGVVYSLEKYGTKGIEDARKHLGQAFHTLQDFYAHSNWIELGNNMPHPQLGQGSPIPNIAPRSENTCDQAPLGNLCYGSNLKTSFLTSGYFGGQTRKYVDGKCRHGGSWDTTPGRGGINKDSSTCTLFLPWVPTLIPLSDEVRKAYYPIIPPPLLGIIPVVVSPHSDHNPVAEQVAIKATIAALRDIKSKVTDRQFMVLLGFGPSLGFAIDTTGSMGGEIAGVKTKVSAIIDERKGTIEEPSQYVLSPFNDPSVGPVTNTSDPDAFKNALSGLSASGGGDCPELSIQGVYNAVSAMDEGGAVFAYTDASSKDESKRTEVYALATDKNIHISWGLFGSCSPYDPAYFYLANRTGGQVFILPRGQTSGITELVNLLSRSNAADILTVAGLLSTTAIVHTFPVDSTITRMTVSITSTGTTAITVKRPDGSIVAAADAGVTRVPMTPAAGSSVIYSITNPQVGQWQMILQGSGDYSAVVNGDSTIALDSFDFVRLGGRPGHQGYYPIDGLPLAGKTLNAIARLSGKTPNIDFELRTKNGQVLQSFKLDSPGADVGNLFGELTIPTQSFVIYALGNDETGHPFQRVLTTQLIPQQLSVIPPIAVGLGKGQDTNYIMQVKNDGIADLFTFAALDNNKFVKSVTPSSANIATGKTQDVKVVLQPPATAIVGTSDTLAFTAKSSTDADVINSAVLVSSVVDPVQLGDANRDGKIDCDDLNLVKVSFGSKTGNIAFNPAVDIDNNGIVNVRDLAVVARKIPAGTKCK
ncbi:MAG: hypothetical protein NTV43_03285 [Methylococcales bacterium]|nr:hypothetical protein [Methylococcales bacterium]